MPASATARALYPPFLLPRPPAWGLPGAGRAEGEEFFFFFFGRGGGRRAEGGGPALAARWNAEQCLAWAAEGARPGAGL